MASRSYGDGDKMSLLGPGRVETFFSPKNCTQPGAMGLDATV